MKKLPQHFAYITALIFFLRGQFYLLGFSTSDVVPYLFTSAIMILAAIYLQGNEQ